MGYYLDKALMRETTIQKIVLEDCHRLNQQFVHMATAEWDLRGQGCFHAWVSRFVAQQWLQMIRNN